MCDNLHHKLLRTSQHTMVKGSYDDLSIALCGYSMFTSPRLSFMSQSMFICNVMLASITQGLRPRHLGRAKTQASCRSLQMSVVQKEAQHRHGIDGDRLHSTVDTLWIEINSVQRHRAITESFPWRDSQLTWRESQERNKLRSSGAAFRR